MTIPFMEDQPWARHQVEHATDNHVVEPRRWHLAERREPLLVLRPKSVHHKGKWPPPALGIASPPGRSFARGFAK